ncbi:hypothetical protein [Cohnella thailandensis]|uniref:Tetratricopeptide repeat protein n=1 Tax=Cohnella thailandensis TaxID=557557 RepID=A0A841STX8_9BACL|nr:hypothetical protein [Cohnella thailandensis]MBB6634692.1 hypothetical protein [Cohnella thailandensis]MBP1972752.1 tetratricopeptide (TPR) repeat protein [Cohnella thailandensis]
MVEAALLGYYAIAAMYLILRLRTTTGARLADATLVVGLPFVGLPLAVLRAIASRMKPVGTPDMAAEGEQEEYEQPLYDRINVNKEKNRVPLEEALRINDMQTRRRLMLDVLKEELNEEVIPLLELAASNEDTETSHYAVTAAMELKRKRMLDIQKHSVEFERDRSNLDAAEAYAESIRQYLASGFMDNRTQTAYRLTYAQLLGLLVDSEACSEEWLEKKILCEMELGNYEEALRCCRLYLEKYPDSEQAYIASLHLYYRLKQGDKFEETLHRLKSSRIRVSNEGLTIIRYWSNKGA